MIKKMAILRVTPEVLRDLMQLPAGVELVRVEMEPCARGQLNLMIEGAGWDTPEGGKVIAAPHATCTVLCSPEGLITSTTIDWQLPKDA